MAFSPSDKVAAVAFLNGKIQFRSVLTGALLFELNAHNDDVTQMQFSPDGQHLVTSSLDLSAKLWAID